ncbi:MAG: transporter [Desulfobacterales bacterium]
METVMNDINGRPEIHTCHAPAPASGGGNLPEPAKAPSIMRWIGILTGIVAALIFSAAVWANARMSSRTLPDSGSVLYQKGCAACHGIDGAGAPTGRLGFETPMPDFTDCNFATREADVDWIYVTEEGGPARAFSRMMPAFGSALNRTQIEKTLNHIRTFCPNEDWPRGELNLPRPIYTTKAYPEDEVVVSMLFNTEDQDTISTELIFEKRFGVRNQIELIIPFGWREQVEADANGNSEWTSSVGDLGLGVKRVLYHDLKKGSIVSLAGEMFFPTGDDDEGFGNDTAVFEPYLAYGQILPLDFFLHSQAGAAFPFDGDQMNEEVFLRVALGRTFLTGQYGRSWSPMVELLGSKELNADADDQWDLAPQLQVSLSTRQHVRLAVGARIPMTDTDVREAEFGGYLLWDWFDGGFFEGW